MSSVRRLLLALLGTTLLLGASACSEASGPTQEQYAAMADDVCEAAGEEIDEVYMDRAVDELLAPMAEEGNVYLDRPERWVRAKVVPEYESLLGRLKAIPPPDGDATYLSDLYADLDARIGVLQARPSDGRAVVESDAQLRDRFVTYGIETCPPPYDEAPDWEDPAKVLEAAEEREEAEAAPPGAEPEDEGQ